MCPLSVVVVVVLVFEFCVKIFTFSSSSSESPCQFQPNLAQYISGWRWNKFVQMKGRSFFQGRDDNNNKKMKIHRRNLKIFYSRTTYPISTKVGTKHLWFMSIQVSSNKRATSFSRGNNSKIAKIHWHRANFSQTHSWVKGIQACSNEGSCPFPRADNDKKAITKKSNY